MIRPVVAASRGDPALQPRRKGHQSTNAEVRIRPEEIAPPRGRCNQDESTGLQNATDFSSDGGGLVKVLDRLEADDRGEGALAEWKSSSIGENAMRGDCDASVETPHCVVPLTFDTDNRESRGPKTQLDSPIPGAEVERDVGVSGHSFQE
jgi:hypothetical protein